MRSFGKSLASGRKALAPVSSLALPPPHHELRAGHELRAPRYVELASALVVLFASATFAGCSDDSADPPATGGQTSNAGTGGASSAGTGGNAMGGTSAAGTSAGTGGSGGAGSSLPTQVYAFAAGLDGFRVNYVCLGPGAGVNCAAVMAPVADADAGADGGEVPAGDPGSGDGFAVVTHDPAVGEPEPGSAKLEVDFSADGQLVVFAVNFDTANLTGKVITARVTMEAGGPAQTAGKLYVKTGPDYVYADSGQLTLTPGVWTTLTYSTPTFYANQAAYDVADVREIGIEFAAPGATLFTPAVIHVDTVQY